MLKKIKQWFRKQILKCKEAKFKVEIKYWKEELSENDSFLIYPLIIHLEYNEDWYKERYLRGISISDSILKRGDIIAKRLRRGFTKVHSNDTYRRLERIRRNQEDRLFFEECEKLANEYDNKQ